MVQNIIEYFIKIGIHSAEFSVETIEEESKCYITINRETYNRIYSLLSYIWIRPGMYISRISGTKDVDNDVVVPYKIVERQCRVKPTHVESITGKTYGLISPEGIFYECDCGGHKYLIPELFESGQFSVMVDDYDADKHSGWMRLTGAIMTECEFTFDYHDTHKIGYGPDAERIFFERKLTKPQIKFILDYNEKLGKTKFNFNYHDYNSIEEVFQYLNFHKYSYEK